MPSVRCETHLFGSRQGYECLAKSAGVSIAEDRALSEFGFGQSSEPGFLDGLATAPTAYARRLPGGRIGVTRVLRGPQDDGGRPTIERRTLVMELRDYLQVRGVLEAFISDNRIWGSSTFERGEPASVGTPAGSAGVPTEVSWLIFDAWFSLRQGANGCVVVGKDDAAARAVLAVAGQVADADAPDFSWGVRLLAPIPWADVATISPYGTLTGSRQAFGIPTSGCVNPAVRSAQDASRVRLPSVATLSEPAVDGPGVAWNDVGRAPAANRAPAPPRVSSLAKPMVLVGIVAMSLLLAAVVVFVKVRSSPSAQVDIGTTSIAPGAAAADAGSGGGAATTVPANPPLPADGASGDGSLAVGASSTKVPEPAAPVVPQVPDGPAPPASTPVQIVTNAPPAPPPPLVTIDQGVKPASPAPSVAAPSGVGEGTSSQPARASETHGIAFQEAVLANLKACMGSVQRSFPVFLQSFHVKDCAATVDAARRADNKASSRSKVSTQHMDEALLMCDAQVQVLRDTVVPLWPQQEDDLKTLIAGMPRAAGSKRELLGPNDPKSWLRELDKKVKDLASSSPTLAARAAVLEEVIRVCLVLDMAHVIQDLDVAEKSLVGSARMADLRTFAEDYQGRVKHMGFWKLSIMRQVDGPLSTRRWPSIERQNKADLSDWQVPALFDALVAKVLDGGAGGAALDMDAETAGLVASVRQILVAHRQLLEDAAK